MRQGLEHYRARPRERNERGYWKLLERLHLIYQREAPDMAYTLEDFVRETDEMVLENALKRDPEAILRRFDPEQRLKGLDPDEVLGRFDPDLIEAWLKKQRRDH